VEIKDLTLKTAKGRRIDVTVFTSFTRNIHGKINGSQGVLHDITDKKELVTLREAERAIRESEERYRRITAAVTDYMFTVRMSEDGPAETVHRDASIAVTGYSPKEFREDPQLWFSIVHPEDWEAVREHLSAFMAGTDVKPLEHRILHKDGSIRWVRRTLVREVDSGGRMVSYDGLLQDVTELKLAEQVQIQLLADLEQVTQELRDFAHVASHDLKAPLRGISALAGWLSTDYADKLDDEGKEQLGLLLRRVERMYSLIDGVLQYSRVTRLKEKSVRVKLGDVVEEVVYNLDVPEHIEVSVDGDLPAVTCGEGGLRQVFGHLLSNAVKFMDKPAGQVHLGCTEEAACWKFYVSDNGPGIEQQHFGRIFKVFQTLEPRDRSESTGIGLAVVKKIVESYGGKIWLRSEVGKGSTFYFTLPKDHELLECVTTASGSAC
jgi:PAS domain S-box-containing protein